MRVSDGLKTPGDAWGYRRALNIASLALHERDFLANPHDLHLLVVHDPTTESGIPQEVPVVGVRVHTISPPTSYMSQHDAQVCGSALCHLFAEVYNSVAMAQACLLAKEGEFSSRVLYVWRMGRPHSYFDEPGAELERTLLDLGQKATGSSGDEFHAHFRVFRSWTGAEQACYFDRVVLSRKSVWGKPTLNE